MALEDLVAGLQKASSHTSGPRSTAPCHFGRPATLLDMDGLPEKAGSFSPFFGDEGTEQVWSRDADSGRFMAQMESNIYTHTILTARRARENPHFSGAWSNPFWKEPEVQQLLPRFHQDVHRHHSDPDHLSPESWSWRSYSPFLDQPIKLINKVLQDTPVQKYRRVFKTISANSRGLSATRSRTSQEPISYSTRSNDFFPHVIKMFCNINGLKFKKVSGEMSSSKHRSQIVIRSKNQMLCSQILHWL